MVPELRRCRGVARYRNDVSSTPHDDRSTPQGTRTLPQDLTDEQLANAGTLESLDDLVIAGLTQDEEDAFEAALAS